MKHLSIFLIFGFSFWTFSALKSPSQETPGVNPGAPFPFQFELKMSTVDSSNLRILYALNATDIRNMETYDDLQRLEIGSHFSKYYSYFVFNNDSLASVWMQNNPNVTNEHRTVGWKGPMGKYQGWSEHIYSEYFKDFSKNELTEYTRMPNKLSHFDSRHTEPLPVQKWEISDDTLTVVGYLCQKAACQFRGRNYTAWFATEIPIGNGPWKFGGLPGLILKVYDEERQFVFECVGIESYPEKFPIQMHDAFTQFKKADRRNHVKMKKEAQENYYRLLLIPNSDDEVIAFQDEEKLNPYNPMELE
ncbi:GLPGLI family protein [Proteiniphilum sp. X52]|uniref:GLPGLI family protein n=1 Tax=Proteiniphilum sp. X52 TaxID=2382159 RepID=UPI000F09DEE1|nr:GLPGLI family protein [Proteiniphilum sp. X52]RNC67102.1 GLPGLI family protein [Proteiniphilum sp. X52]